MNFPKTIFAYTDLVCSEEPKEGCVKYIHAEDAEKLMIAINNLMEIVEGVRSVRWSHDHGRLVDTPEWCALYSLWRKHK